MRPSLLEPILETVSFTGLIAVLVFWLGVAQSGSPI